MTAASEASGATVGLPGSILANARNERGMTIDQLALALRYSPKQLTALEAGDYAALPGVTVVRGMMRAYAKHVGLDPEPLLVQLRTSLSAPPPKVKMNEMSVPFPVRSTPVYRYYILGSLILVLLALLMLNQWSDSIQSFIQGVSGAPAPLSTQASRSVTLTSNTSQPLSSENVAAVEPQPIPAEPVIAVVTPPPPPVAVKPEPATPASQKRIVLKFEDDSWVHIRNAKDETLFHMFNPAGTEQVVTGRPPFNLVIGAANGVRIQYDNAPFDLAPHIREGVARLVLN